MFSEFEGYVEFFEDTIKEYGGVGRNGKKKYVMRNNTSQSSENGAYFGCIAEGEEPSGVYSDLSIVVFPSNEADHEKDRWFISLAVGSLGFKNDYDLVTLPGIRRLFRKYLKGNFFVKNDFQDIESYDGFHSFCSDVPETLNNAVKIYEKVILACSLFDPNKKEESEKLIRTYLAMYASIRRWPSNVNHKNNVNKAFNQHPAHNDDKEIIQQSSFDVDEENVLNLLLKRKYVVLQGAPGTGKTRLAKSLAKKNSAGKDDVFFTQFHAETSYSDFVYGIVPDVDSEALRYSLHEGVFVRAVRAALANREKKVFLIIDEINRANLSNVLGPCFYLFEPKMSDGNAQITICPKHKEANLEKEALELDKLPDNFFVIATMNTADRSLAVVDFALRRRFAWYTLFPHAINDSLDTGLKFCEEEFNEISDIFERYAKDEELSLQPGHAYFIVSDSDPEGIKERLRYEVMPLIKEYLIDGMLPRAKDEFIRFFREQADVEMFN